VSLQEYHQELIQRLLDGRIADKDGLQKAKLELCRKYRLSTLPPNSETLALVRPADLEAVEAILQRKPVRTLSGVAVVAVMTSPATVSPRQVHLLPWRSGDRLAPVIYWEGAGGPAGGVLRFRPL